RRLQRHVIADHVRDDGTFAYQRDVGVPDPTSHRRRITPLLGQPPRGPRGSLTSSLVPAGSLPQSADRAPDQAGTMVIRGWSEADSYRTPPKVFVPPLLTRSATHAFAFAAAPDPPEWGKVAA